MIYLELLFVLLLIVLNGIFAMSELAIVSAKKVHLKRLAEEGCRSAQLALDFSHDTGRFLPTVQIGITLIGVLSGAFSGASFSGPVTAWLIGVGITPDTAQVVAVTGIVVAVTYVTLIIGELVPKELALRNPERLAMLIAPIIYWLSRLTSPVVSLLDGSCKLVLMLMGARKKPVTTVTEEEVRSLIAEGTEHGLFHESERDMISGIMLLADKPIRAFMVPRTDVITIDHDASHDEIHAILRAHHYSRYPVRRRHAIIGVLQTKDMLNHLLAGSKLSVKQLIQPIAAFPDSTPTLKVIEYLKKSPIHMASVIDEHGAFAGVITLIDLVEVITGELYQQGDAPMEFTEREDGTWLVDAGILSDIVFQKLGIPGLRENKGYHTLAGFVLHRLGVIPKPADHFEYQGFRFEVVDMDAHRVDKVLVSKV